MPGHARTAALAMSPCVGAASGAVWDERDHLGFTNWRALCAGDDVALSTVFDLTLQLLPTALAAFLLTSLLLMCLALRARCETDLRCYVAAHLGCVLAMPLAMLLCARPWPLATMLAVDVTFVAVVALVMFNALRLVPGRGARRSVLVRIPGPKQSRENAPT